MRRIAAWCILVASFGQAFFFAGFLLAGAAGPWWAVALALAVEALFLWVVVRIARRLLRPEHVRPEDMAPRPHRRAPVAPVPPEALEDLPEPVTACPDCGYLGVRMPGIRDGLWPGGGELTDRVVCPRCGYQGLAARFDTRADYGAFLRDLAGSGQRVS